MEAPFAGSGTTMGQRRPADARPKPTCWDLPITFLLGSRHAADCTKGGGLLRQMLPRAPGRCATDQTRNELRFCSAWAPTTASLAQIEAPRLPDFIRQREMLPRLGGGQSSGAAEWASKRPVQPVIAGEYSNPITRHRVKQRGAMEPSIHHGEPSGKIHPRRAHKNNSPNWTSHHKNTVNNGAGTPDCTE